MPLFPFNTAPRWIKITKSYSDFAAASPLNNIEIYSLAPGDVIHNAIVKHTIAFNQSAVPVTGEVVGVGDAVIITFPISLDEIPVNPSSISITDTVETFTDNGLGILIGDQGGTGTINYMTGAGSVTFNAPPALLQNITADYTQNAVTDYSVSIGKLSDLEAYSGAYSVYPAPAGNLFGPTVITSPAPEDFVSFTSIRAQANSASCDLSALTTGEVDLYLEISTLP